MNGLMSLAIATVAVLGCGLLAEAHYPEDVRYGGHGYGPERLGAELGGYGERYGAERYGEFRREGLGAMHDYRREGLGLGEYGREYGREGLGLGDYRREGLGLGGYPEAGLYGGYPRHSRNTDKLKRYVKASAREALSSNPKLERKVLEVVNNPTVRRGIEKLRPKVEELKIRARPLVKEGIRVGKEKLAEAVNTQNLKQGIQAAEGAALYPERPIY